MRKMGSFQRNQFYYLSLCVAFVVYQIPGVVENADLGSAQRFLCQATYYNQYRDALAQYPKAQIIVNKFFFNGTCQTQCLLKAGGKTIQTLNAIITPDFTICNGGNTNKFNKQKMVCFDGTCQTIAQIATILGTTSTTTP